MIVRSASKIVAVRHKPFKEMALARIVKSTLEGLKMGIHAFRTHVQKKKSNTKMVHVKSVRYTEDHLKTKKSALWILVPVERNY